jgi:hypothetical protein
MRKIRTKGPLIKGFGGTLSRRKFLWGTGATLALPWLEAIKGPQLIKSAYAQQAELTKRFLGFYVPCGFNMNEFWPNGTGQLTEASLAGTSLQALTPHLNELLMIKGLDNHAGSAQGDGPGDHARGTATFLTCVHPNKHASDVQIGPSIDQHIAQHYASETRFASVEIGCEGGGNENACDSGYSCAYSRNIAWQDAQTPLPKETSPRLLFQRLFGTTDPNATPEFIANRRRQRRSVLDFVLADANRLNQSLGGSDRARLEAYMDGIRTIEQRIELSDQDAVQCGAGLTQPTSAPQNRDEYAALMLDILVEAMRCDLTRVGTFMLGNGGSNRSHTEIGISQGHHELSHHQNDATSLDRIAQIDRWEIGMLAGLLSRMKNIDMGTHTLLDETTVYFSSEIEDGNRHYHYNLPIVLAGRSGGLTNGRSLDVSGSEANNQPVANLFMRIAQDAGVSINSFGDDGTQALNI